VVTGFEEPVLSIFGRRARRWIAWTPQGYYACSPYGERLIAWQVNNGIDKIPRFTRVRFRASLLSTGAHQVPDSSRRYQAGLWRWRASSSGNRSLPPASPTCCLRVSRSPPPQTADDKPISVRATAQGSAKNPIVAMRPSWYDGRPVQRRRGREAVRQAAQKRRRRREVTLPPGSHTLAVIAESPVSKGMTPGWIVHAGRGRGGRPNLYVVAVGVSAYPGNMKLNYAASDAILLTSTLQAKSKGVFRHIEMKVSPTSRAPRRTSASRWTG